VIPSLREAITSEEHRCDDSLEGGSVRPFAGS
jgi:hypothetical protein